MSMAVVAAMVAFASCGGNNNKGGEAAPAADADAPAVVDECCGDCCTECPEVTCDGCTEAECAACPDAEQCPGCPGDACCEK